MPGLLSLLFGFRWSLYVVRNGNELVYALHENSVIRIVGYVMGLFAGGAAPRPPWSLHLNFNRKNKSFELRPHHFSTSGDQLTTALMEEIQRIDPKYRVKGGEPVFVDAKTRKQLRLLEDVDYSDLQGMIDRLGEPRQPTFYSVMREIFGKPTK